jgi:hypothetical protein
MTLKTFAILLSLSASGALLLPPDAQAGGMRVSGIHPAFIGHPGIVRNPGFPLNRNVGIRPGLVGSAHHLGRFGGTVAAIGFVSAAMASDWAGPPPAPGYCWYYTDITRWYGFWDQCP